MKAVVAEFSLDSDDSALSRLVQRVEASQARVAAELSLDEEDSALTRLHRVMLDHQNAMLRNQNDLAAKLDRVLTTLTVRKQEAAKSTRHGIEFEEALGDHLRADCEAAGDILEDTGSTTGLVPNCKIGDHVLTFGPEKAAAGARIVFEAKESASYDLAKSLAEAEVARRNRQATVCVFVHSIKTAPANIPSFARYGHDILVKWDADDDLLDANLKAAILVATALSVKASSHNHQDAASFERVDRAIEKVRKAIDGFDEINKFAETTRSSAVKILERARIMQETLAPQIDAIFAELLKLKESAADA